MSGYICNPKGVPELPLLSSTDISKTTPSWECRPLTVPELLEQGIRFTYDVAKVLRWMEGL